MKALEVAKYLLSCTDIEKGQTISNLALQKLLYYCQGYYLALTKGKEPLFEEEIEAWRYGPVVRDVYNHYKVYGNGSLPTDKVSEELFKQFTEKQLDCIENVFDSLKGYSAITLMYMTHREKPWLDTELSEIIPKEKIYNFFKNKKIN